MKTCIRWPRQSRARAAGVACRMAVALVTVAGACIGEATEAQGPTAGARQRIVDPAVTPAGGAGCTTCGPAGCRHAHGGHHGHHAGCRDGVCVPYCPVRPQQFGYYGTRWRKWPGQEVMRVSGETAVAPVQPPRSEVPGAAEESLAPRTGDPLADETATRRPTTDLETQEPAPMPTPPQRPEPMPPAEPAPEAKPAVPPAPEADEEPQAKPAPAPQPVPDREPDATKPEPPPAPKPAPQRPEDENLFEVLSGPGWRAKRKFPIGPDASSAASSVRPAGHVRTEDTREVPPVAFDPATETRRLRSTR